jgi:hypothetical protein
MKHAGFFNATNRKLLCIEEKTVLTIHRHLKLACDFHYKKTQKGGSILSSRYPRTSSKRIFFPYHSNGDFTYYLPVTVLATLLLFSELLKMLSRVAMKALCQQQQGRVVVSLVRSCSAVAAPGQRDLVNYPRR